MNNKVDEYDVTVTRVFRLYAPSDREDDSLLHDQAVALIKRELDELDVCVEFSRTRWVGLDEKKEQVEEREYGYWEDNNGR